MEKIVGFDIGESSVKLVYFAGADLKKAVTAELPDNMVSGSRILSMDAMADFLRQTAKSNGIPLTHAALVLPSTEVFTRELVMPAMTEQQLLYNLPYEFRDYLTEEKNKYFFDYSMREVLRDESGQPTEMNLLACATLKSTVESYRAMLRRAGFRLRVLTPSECAYSAVLQAYYRRTQQEGRDLCVVNLGHSATFLYIYRGGHFASRREIEVGMSDLEHLVADQCSVDVHVAHEYVRQNYNHVLESEQARELYGRIAVEVVKAAYASVHTEYTQMQELLKGYDRLLMEYRTYSMEWATDGSEDNGTLVDRQKALDLLEQEMLSRGRLVSLQVSGNKMVVSMSGMSLDQISRMFDVIQQSPIVSNVELNLASTEDGNVSTILDFTVRITLRSAEEADK